MAARHDELFFDSRFCGPPGTVNGGFACGAIAACCDGPVEVTLRRPLPPARRLAVQRGDASTLSVFDRDTLLAEARPAPVEADLAVPAVSADRAEAVAGLAAYFADPAFPGCFVCGTGRAPHDGLRIFPGRLPDRPVWAAPWTPDSSVADADGRVRPEVLWAALDCPSGIAAGEAAELAHGTTAVLGRMAASLIARPRAAQECRVLAWPTARHGRTLAAASAILDPDDAVLATARTLWIAVPRPAPRHPAGATA